MCTCVYVCMHLSQTAKHTPSPAGVPGGGRGLAVSLRLVMDLGICSGKTSQAFMVFFTGKTGGSLHHFAMKRIIFIFLYFFLNFSSVLEDVA